MSSNSDGAPAPGLHRAAQRLFDEPQIGAALHQEAQTETRSHRPHRSQRTRR